MLLKRNFAKILKSQIAMWLFSKNVFLRNWCARVLHKREITHSLLGYPEVINIHKSSINPKWHSRKTTDFKHIVIRHLSNCHLLQKVFFLLVF